MGKPIPTRKHSIYFLIGRFANLTRHIHVASAKTKPRANRCNSGYDFRMDAVGIYVHARHFRFRTNYILDCEQYDNFCATVYDYAISGL